jgi:hypothetical protein
MLDFRILPIILVAFSLSDRQMSVSQNTVP